MKRNAFLITAVLFCLASLAAAAEQKKDLASQSAPSEQQIEMARNNADAGMDYASAKSVCAPKQTSESKLKNTQDDREGDPQASQNDVEYGGAG
jgi:orotidine-5'-phosphate decarboxylase